ncbi:MAG: ATPase, partial [Sphingobacteriia bacterium 32-37-4]
MSNTTIFAEAVQKGYQFKGEQVKIGCGMLNGGVVKEANVFIPLKTMNRHGLIAGATGTGKTKTLQLISECLSDNSVPVLVMDIKGDLSGIAVEGVSNEKIIERSAKLGIQWKPNAYPAELLTLTGGNGVKLRATVSEFGPVLL